MQGKARQEAFRALRVKHGFEEWTLHQHRSLAASCWLRDHLDVHAAQKIASRAFKAVERWSFGQSGKPRFKRYGELESVEGKSNEAGIRTREGRVLWNGPFGKLELPLVEKKDDQVHAYALKLAADEHVKYVRLLFRTIRGEERVFTQLVLEGLPWVKLNQDFEPKHPVRDGKGGLDVGPSHVAVVTEGQVKSFPFCEGLDRKEKAIRVCRRHLDRQRRANNPGNFNPDGTIRKGRKTWKESLAQARTRVDLAEVQRAMAAARKSLQGALAHTILAMANDLISEKVSKKAWQALWGRSVAHKAPGMFETRTGILAKASGGGLELVPTWKTCLSSRCLCGLRKKKPLKERKHQCGCAFLPEGLHADRDEFSAFLALFCQGGQLDETAAREAWRSWGADCLLRSSSNQACGSRASGASGSTARKPREARLRRTRPEENRGQSGSSGNRSGPRREVVPVSMRRRRAPGGKPTTETSP